MSYKNRYNHKGRWRRNERMHNLICDILFNLKQFDKLDVVRMMT